MTATATRTRTGRVVLTTDGYSAYYKALVQGELVARVSVPARLAESFDCFAADVATASINVSRLIRALNDGEISGNSVRWLEKRRVQ